MNPGRLLVPALRAADRDLATVWPQARELLDLGVGGFILFGGDTAMSSALLERARDHTGRPIILAADLERGAGQQLADATALPPAAALSRLGSEAIAEAARTTAREAAAAGIGWVLAPVADLDVEPANPIVGTRSFGAEPDPVGSAVRTWIEAAQAEGVLACAKHFPGHGRTVSDSHQDLPVVSAPRTALEREDLAPFRAAVDANVASIMMAHVAFPNLDPTGRPASLSPSIVELLRTELGFEGLITTDALMMGALERWGSATDAAVEALRAGVDLLLYPSDPHASAKAMQVALDAGSLDPDRLARSVERLHDAVATVRIRPLDGLQAAVRRPSSLALASLYSVGGEPPRVRAGAEVRLCIVDDDEVTRAMGPEEPPDRDVLRRSLEDRGASVRRVSESEPSDVIAVFSDVRAWKGRAGLQESTVARIGECLRPGRPPTIVLFGHPRLASELPEGCPVVIAWSGDPPMQEAAAEYLSGGP